MKKEDALYNYWLESQIKHARKSMGFGLDYDAEIDSSLLFNHIERKNPAIIDQMINNTFNAGSVNKAELIDILGQTKKGTIITWQNNGETMYFFNTGKNLKNQNNIIAIGKNLNYKDFNNLKKTFLKKLLLKDIEEINKKIIKEQVEQKRKTLAGKVLSSLIYPDKKNEPSAFFFERDIIREIRAGNGTAKGIARSLITNMDKAEKDKLNRLLINKGIKSPDAMEQYLAHLQEMALRPVEKSKKKVLCFER